MNIFGKTGIILPGGGLKCAFQVGSLLAFEEAGVGFDIAQGISGGALNVAKFFENGAKALKAIWLNVEKHGPGYIFRRWDAVKHLVKGDNSLFNSDGIAALLGQLEVTKLVNHPMPIEIVVLNETLEELELIKNHQFRDSSLEEQEKFRKFIMASASFAGLLPPQIINDQVYSDGRIWMFENFGDCDTIFIVDPGQPQIVINNSADLANRKWHKRLIQASTLGYDNWAERELELFAAKHQFQFFPEPEKAVTHKVDWVGKIWQKIKGTFSGGPTKKKIIVIRPSLNIETLRMDYFIKCDLTISMNHGYARTKEMLEKMKA